MTLDYCADIPVEEQDPTVVAHIMMHDGPKGNRIQNTQSQMWHSRLKHISLVSSNSEVVAMNVNNVLCSL